MPNSLNRPSEVEEWKDGRKSGVREGSVFKQVGGGAGDRSDAGQKNVGG